jgi:hypothetical protein
MYKPNVLEKEHIERFYNGAPDEEYLIMKVSVLVFKRDWVFILDWTNSKRCPGLPV